mgnify:CR=1 FL=1
MVMGIHGGQGWGEDWGSDDEIICIEEVMVSSKGLAYFRVMELGGVYF